jgi:hypothetical protein
MLSLSLFLRIEESVKHKERGNIDPSIHKYKERGNIDPSIHKHKERGNIDPSIHKYKERGNIDPSILVSCGFDVAPFFVLVY